MKNLLRSFFVCLVSCITVSVVSGAAPPLNVTVSDTSGNVVFKGTTKANGTFTTGNLKIGNYVVQFASSNAAVKANRYALVVSAGAAKISANAIEGERFAGAGIAMKITVGILISDILKEHPGLNNPAAIRAMEQENRKANLKITGQVTAER